MAKVWFILLVLAFVLSGCVQTQYRSTEYVLNGDKTKALPVKEIRVSHTKAMVNDSKSDLSLVLENGAGLDVGKIVTTADPNSARAIGRAVAEALMPFLAPSP